MPTVLLVGEDTLLLQTRAAVVQTTGAGTVCAKAASALAVQQVQHCDLVILCHTVPQASCLLLTAAFRKLWPATPVLLITRTMTMECSDANRPHEISSADPRRLVQRAVQLLAHRPSGLAKPPALLH